MKCSWLAALSESSEADHFSTNRSAASVESGTDRRKQTLPQIGDGDNHKRSARCAANRATSLVAPGDQPSGLSLPSLTRALSAV